MPLKPEPLRRDDLVAVVAPAGSYEPDRLERGCRILEGWGLRIRRPSKEQTPLRYLAANDEIRAGELREALADDEVKAILVARGGFGSARLFDRLRLAPVRGTPKVFVGFSDTTVLLTRLLQEAGWISFHGPMVAADLPDLVPEARERFRRFLFDDGSWWEGQARECWRAGRAEGRLAGGCLSILVSTLGTPYEFRTDHPTVLFLEDVNEKPYRVERMLVQLRDAGKFESVTALVIGAMPGCDEGEGSSVLENVFRDVLAAHKLPMLFGLPAGHGSDNIVLPFGCRVGVDAGARMLELRESPFAERKQ